MKPYDYYIIQSYKEFEQKNPEKTAKDLDLLSNTLDDLTKTLHESKIKDHENLESVLIKLIYHIKSIITLSKFNKLKSQDIIDLGSIYILTRAVIENYLTINYLFSPLVDLEQKKFRFDLYKLSGIANRQSYFTISPQSKLKKAQEAEEMAILKESIQNNNIYLAFDAKQKRNLKLDSINPSARTSSWYDLILDSSLDSEKFLSLWKWFSSYSHSEFIGLIQIRDIDSKIQSQNLNLALYVALMINGVMIHDLITYYPSIKIKYNTMSSKIHGLVDVLVGTAKGSASSSNTGHTQ